MKRATTIIIILITVAIWGISLKCAYSLNIERDQTREIIAELNQCKDELSEKEDELRELRGKNESLERENESLRKELEDKVSGPSSPASPPEHSPKSETTEEK